MFYFRGGYRLVMFRLVKKKHGICYDGGTRGAKRVAE